MAATGYKFGQTDYDAGLAMLNHEAHNTLTNDLDNNNLQSAMGQMSGLLESWLNRAVAKNSTISEQMAKPHQLTKWDPNPTVIAQKAAAVDPRIKALYDSYLYQRSQGGFNGGGALLPKVTNYFNRALTDELYPNATYHSWYDKSYPLGAFGDLRSGGQKSLQQEFLYDPSWKIKPYYIDVDPSLKLKPSETGVGAYNDFEPLHYPGEYGGKQFSAAEYLQKNPDVQKANIDPAAHASQYGAAEGRLFDYDLASIPRYLAGWGGAQDPNYQGWVAPGRPDSIFGKNQYALDEFDAAQYLRDNPDVATAGIDPAYHASKFGRAEDRISGIDPLTIPRFLAGWGGAQDANYRPWIESGDTRSIAARGQSGFAEFDPAKYLIENPDVHAAGIDPAYHASRFGRDEGRVGAMGIDPASIPRFLSGWGGAQPPGYASWLAQGPLNAFGKSAIPSDPYPLGSGISYHNGQTYYGGVPLSAGAGRPNLFDPVASEKAYLNTQVDQINAGAAQSKAVENQLTQNMGVPMPTFGINGTNQSNSNVVSQNQNAYLNDVNNSLAGLAPVVPPPSSFLPQQHSFGGGGLFFSGGF